MTLITVFALSCVALSQLRVGQQYGMLAIVIAVYGHRDRGCWVTTA